MARKNKNAAIGIFFEITQFENMSEVDLYLIFVLNAMDLITLCLGVLLVWACDSVEKGIREESREWWKKIGY